MLGKRPARGWPRSKRAAPDALKAPNRIRREGENRFDCTTAGHHSARLECPLHHAQGVVEGPLHLVQHHAVGTSQNDRAGRGELGFLHQDQLVVRDALLKDLGSLTQCFGIERLLTLQIGCKISGGLNLV